MSGAALATAARALVGTRFVLNGRDPATGLDCLGVLDRALDAIGQAADLPRGYSLRCRGDMGAAHIALAAGLRTAAGTIAEGDVLLVRCSPVQLHLIIALDTMRVVHAHAGLRRVVISRLAPAWEVAGHWHLPASV